ncbi:serine/threonine-protein kinase [Lentzea nigeriaca]|uniref:serine/threonine-protein kinase n=1 Tax=Lentzea nigeriaca TaxID=1128665 RepID=UPI00195F1AB9|nr:serine/threonine-protein kinase [Lentzea nigeriaca]MBM7856540.1 serine/threonine protein kinase [Lentzea nigeriaca]
MREVGNRRYRLLRELGRGGMGAVWLGKDTVLGRDVAVKELLLPGNVPVAERVVYQERVLREARIASQLRDPAVVTVFDLITEDDQTFIVMELIDAPTLDELVDLDGPLDVKAAATLAQQLLNALEAAHESGVVHRDVKPGNVMVPGRGTAKLTDFGIAQSIDDPRLTATGTLIGSPAYMSPERLAGGPATPAWDLWALGATLFYAVEGRGAFDRPTTSATILAVMSERPQPRVSGPLGELITGLLEPDPERRLGAAQTHRLIERALHSEPGAALTQQVPPAPPIPSAPPVVLPPTPRKRRPIALILSATLTPLFLVGALISLYLTVFKPMLDNLQAGDRQDGPVSTVAMQPVLTRGPGGDLGEDTLRVVTSSGCLTWTPAKGAPKIDSKNRVGCYAEHDTEFLYSTLANTETEKDVPYPGTEELTKIGGTRCARMFLSDKVAGQDKEKTLRYWVIIPTAEAWKMKTENGYRNSDRLIHCFVGKADGSKLTEPIVKS